MLEAILEYMSVRPALHEYVLAGMRVGTPDSVVLPGIGVAETPFGRGCRSGDGVRHSRGRGGVGVLGGVGRPFRGYVFAPCAGRSSWCTWTAPRGRCTACGWRRRPYTGGRAALALAPAGTLGVPHGVLRHTESAVRSGGCARLGAEVRARSSGAKFEQIATGIFGIARSPRLTSVAQTFPWRTWTCRMPWPQERPLTQSHAPCAAASLGA